MKILIFAILLCLAIYAFNYIIAIAFFIGLLGSFIGGTLALAKQTGRNTENG